MVPSTLSVICSAFRLSLALCSVLAVVFHHLNLLLLMPVSLHFISFCALAAVFHCAMFPFFFCLNMSSLMFLSICQLFIHRLSCFNELSYWIKILLLFFFNRVKFVGCKKTFQQLQDSLASLKMPPFKPCANLCFQVVREDRKKVISFASELKKLTSRSRSMTTGGGGVDGPAHSKDDRAACCVALTELQEWGHTLACCLCMRRATEVPTVCRL